MQDFFKHFEIEYTPDLEPYYRAAIEKNDPHFWEFEDLGIFTDLLAPLQAIRDELKKDERNRLYGFFLQEVIRTEDHALIGRVCRPKRSLESEVYDSLPLFALLREVPALQADLAAKGVPAEVIDDTCGMFENQIHDFIDLYGHIGIAVYTVWMMLFVRGHILRIGRFNFELHKAGKFAVFTKGKELCILQEGRFHRSGHLLGAIGYEEEEGAFEAAITETADHYIGHPVVDGLCTHAPVYLSKTEWKKVAGQGDAVISVHIPSGGPLDFESNSRDFARAEEIFPKTLGDFKLFYCASWLLDPQIKEILGRETNLTRFGDRFTRFPHKSKGKSVFTYLYLTQQPDLPTLPENTSIQRAVKRHLLGGGQVLDTQGVILKGTYSLE